MVSWIYIEEQYIHDIAHDIRGIFLFIMDMQHGIVFMDNGYDCDGKWDDFMIYPVI